MTILKGRRWLAAAALIFTAAQFVFFGIGSSSIGTLAYKLMVVSLTFVDQSAVPTLWATREGWPLPTLFGFVLYAAFSAVSAFLILWIVSALFTREKKAPIQPPVLTRGSGT
jgi:hypothetical protein